MNPWDLCPVLAVQYGPRFGETFPVAKGLEYGSRLANEGSHGGFVTLQAGDEVMARRFAGLLAIFVFQYAPYEGGGGKTYWVTDSQGIEVPVVSSGTSHALPGPLKIRVRPLYHDTSRIEPASTLVRKRVAMEATNKITTTTPIATVATV